MRTDFRERSSRKNLSFEEQTMSKDKYEHIFVPNGGYCVYCTSNIFQRAGKVFRTSLLLTAGNVHFSVFPATILWTKQVCFSFSNKHKRSHLELNLKRIFFHIGRKVWKLENITRARVQIFVGLLCIICSWPSFIPLYSYPQVLGIWLQESVEEFWSNYPVRSSFCSRQHGCSFHMGKEQENLLVQGHPVLAIQRRHPEHRLGLS